MKHLQYLFLIVQILLEKLFLSNKSSYDEMVAQKFLFKIYEDTDAKNLSDIGFQKYSQNNEDGILLYIFAKIGVKNRTSVEICSGNCIECNTANLIINHGWNSLLIDGNPVNTKIGKLFYNHNSKTKLNPPTILNAWVTRDNINSLLADEGFEGDIDLLSLDMDGMDWWILKHLNQVNPRVIVLEYNDLLGPEKSLTIPYSDSFSAKFINGAPIFSGASLNAFVKLLKQKRYRLVGIENLGFNAFFIREDVSPKTFKEVTIEEVFDRPKTKKNIAQNSHLLRNLKWLKV